MSKKHTTQPAQSLAQRNAEHVPCYWLMLTPFEAHELAEGRLPEQVQQMAKWLDTDGLSLTISAPDWAPYAR